MAQPLTAPFPPGLVLSDGWIVRIAAVNPTTGAAVAGVDITEALITVDNLSADASLDLSSGPFMLVPGPGA